jgi:hypothetical protein
MNNSNQTTTKKIDHKTIGFSLSDSDNSDDDNNTLNYDIKTNSELLDKLDLKYFPEPYNTLGQFMVSAISGATCSYILASRAKNIKPHNEYLKAYFSYCKKIESDDYVESILTALKLDRSNTEDNIKFEIILERILNVCNKLMNELMESFTEKSEKSEKYEKYILCSDEDFSIDSFNLDVIKDIIGLIKFSEIADLV